MIDILTGTAFDSQKRLHHCEDEGALEFPSSVSSRARGLLALRAQNWGAGGAHTLPWDYRIAYCESDGTQTVQLPIRPSPGISVVMEFMAIKLDGNPMFGCTLSAKYFQVRAINRGFAMYCTRSTTPASRSGLSVGVRHTMVFGPTSYTIDGLDNGGAFGTETIDANIFLFSMNQGKPYFRSSLRVYSFSANYNGTDVIRLTPCVIDGVSGFWDDVSGAFLTDTFGGGLIPGPQI